MICCQTLKLSEKPSAFITGKRDECCSSVTQSSTVLVSKQSPKCSRLAVPIRADHDKGRLAEALGLEPSFAATRSIGCQHMFRDNAFKSLLGACFEQCITITIKLITKLNTALVIVSQ